MNGIRKSLPVSVAYCRVLRSTGACIFRAPSSAQQANAEQGGPYNSLIIRGRHGDRRLGRAGLRPGRYLREGESASSAS